MPRSTRAPRPYLSIIAGGGLLLLSAALPGCGSEKAQLVTSAEPYQGPPLSMDSSGPQHIAILAAPTSGWAAQLDQTRRQLGSMDVFITARKPNPAFAQTQTVVQHRIATSVPATEDATVYLRVLEFNQDPAKEPYRLAARAPAIPANPAPPPVPPPSSAAPPPAPGSSAHP
jgi:hypothetical protein